MAGNSTSALDAAVESIEAEDLVGVGAPTEAPSDPFAAPPPPPPPAETKKPGRKRDPNSRRSRAGAYGGSAQQTASTGASGQVHEPPAPPRQYEPVPAAAVAETIKQLDAIAVKMVGTVPLSNDEALAGGAVFAPILDHYMPMLAEKGGLWLPAFTWVVMAYGPRAYEVLDRRQQAIELKKRGLTQGARSGGNGSANFHEEDSSTVSVARN